MLARIHVTLACADRKQSKWFNLLADNAHAREYLCEGIRINIDIVYSFMGVLLCFWSRSWYFISAKNKLFWRLRSISTSQEVV